MFKTITTVAAGLTLATASLATAAQAAAPAGPTGLISATHGGTCIDAAGNGTKAGTRVILWTCDSKDTAQRWTVASDGTLRVHGASGQCLATDSKGKAVLGACTITWLPRADYTVAGSSATQPTHRCLDTTSTKRGTQLYWSSCSTSTRQHFKVPGTVYGKTTLTNRPDSGGGGDTWALDTMTRRASVTSLGGGKYEGSVIDRGSFVTVPGNLVPNQGIDKGKTLGDALVGTMSGGTGYDFTAPGTPSTKRIPASMNGVGTTGTGDWMTLFFPAGTKLDGSGMRGTGAEGWSWSYRGVDNCHKTEKWTDSYANSGQNPADGDITAPAPGTC